MIAKGRQEPRVNERIRIREVRLIDPDGTQIGVVPTHEALARAREKGLDLVEVAGESRPPVCKIMDYGRFKYEQKKKHSGGKKPHSTKIKHVRLRPKTDEHDYQVKLRRALKFLGQGDKVQIELLFRGREMVHQDRGRALVERMIADLQEHAKVERGGKMEGRKMTVLLTGK